MKKFIRGGYLLVYNIVVFNCIVARNPARIINENIQTRKSGQLIQ